MKYAQDRLIEKLKKKNEDYHRRKSIKRGRAYMICIFCVLVGIMLSELCRRVF